MTASLLLPLLILIAAKFIGPMKRRPRTVYGICAALVVVGNCLGFSAS
jgi:hypothetical protein